MSPSRGQADFFLAMARQLERDRFGLITAEKLVGLQELGNEGAELLGERLQSRRVGGQAGNIVARRYPDSSLGIPVSADMVEEGSHGLAWITRCVARTRRPVSAEAMRRPPGTATPSIYGHRAPAR